MDLSCTLEIPAFFHQSFLNIRFCAIKAHVLGNERVEDSFVSEFTLPGRKFFLCNLFLNTINYFFGPLHSWREVLKNATLTHVRAIIHVLDLVAYC